jgi:hypothetical protein
MVMILFSLATGDADTLILNILFVLAFGTPIFGIPIACAVAVLRYRLYDLDVVVKKTVVAAVLAATFTAVYVLVVVGVGAVTGHPGGSPLTFTAAALAAVLLQPVRVRAGQLADRLVYGRRATPYEVLSEFSGQIAGTYSTEDVLPRMPGCWSRPPGRGGPRYGCERRAASSWRRPGRPPTGRPTRPPWRPSRPRAARSRPQLRPPPARTHPRRKRGNQRAAGTMGSRGPSWWSTRANGSARCGSPARRGSR